MPMSALPAISVVFCGSAVRTMLSGTDTEVSYDPRNQMPHQTYRTVQVTTTVYSRLLFDYRTLNDSRGTQPWSQDIHTEKGQQNENYLSTRESGGEAKRLNIRRNMKNENKDKDKNTNHEYQVPYRMIVFQKPVPRKPSCVCQQNLCHRVSHEVNSFGDFPCYGIHSKLETRAGSRSPNKRLSSATAICTRLQTRYHTDRSGYLKKVT